MPRGSSSVRIPSERSVRLLVPLLLLASVLVLLLHGCDGRIPPPSGVTVPKQTPIQAAQWSRLSAIAQEASAAATPTLLNYFDSTEFRSGISGLPFANESSETILSMIGPVIVGSTVTHNVEIQNQEFVLDVTAQTLTDLQFIPNIWEMIAMGLLDLNTVPSLELIVLSWIDNGEQKLFGLSPFQGEGNEKYYNLTLGEAQARVGYAALNMWQLADGVQLFGPVTLVLDSEYLRSISVISPVDTGQFISCCLNAGPMCPFTNKSCAPITFGTYDYYNHLLLATAYQSYWNYTLPQLLHRIYGQPTPNVSLWDNFFYWEVDVLGNLIFPYAVSYIIADFPSVFGSELGLDLQNWCQQESWVLVWSHGFYNYSQETMQSDLNTAATTSMLDPTTTNFLIDYSPSSNLTAMFWEQWKAANTTRGEIIEQKLNSTYAEHLWNELWMNTYSNLTGAYHLHRPTSFNTTCGSLSTPCIGVDDTNNCICYSTG